jgi:predicted O-methyltransferase YrrM
MSSRTINLTPTVYQYILDHSVREPVVLRELREATAKIEHAGMQISPEQGQFMQMLAKLVGAKRCIEIGVFTGYSSISVALALPPDGQIIACDVSEEWTSMARKYWEKAGVAGKIDLRLAPANQTLDALLAAGEAGKFDFAFIDADKPAYEGYYERCLKLLRPGGLIAIDNTLWSGKVADSTVQDDNTVALRKLNDFVHRDERVDVSLLPVGDGLTLILKK